MPGLTTVSIDRGRSPAGDNNEWATRLAHLLKIALEEIGANRHAATAAIAKAQSLLRIQLDRPSQLGGASPVSPQSSVSGGLAKWRVRRIIRFIEEHLDEPIPVTTLSKVAGLSFAYFSRSFKRAFGEPPHAYLTRPKGEPARNLMLFSDVSLSEVAQACGFADQAHFSRRFLQRTGQSPAVWRREHRDRECRSADVANAQSPPAGVRGAARAASDFSEEQAHA